MKIEITVDVADKVTGQNLKQTLDYFKEMLCRYDDQDAWVAIFRTDRDEDIKEIKKHIKACKLLVSWFGEPRDE